MQETLRHDLEFKGIELYRELRWDVVPSRVCVKVQVQAGISLQDWGLLHPRASHMLISSRRMPAPVRDPSHR